MTEYRVIRVDSRTVIEHGVAEGLRLQASRNAQRAYAIHRGDALIARSCRNTELARHHARKARALVAQFAAVIPFSAQSFRRYIEAIS